MSNLPHSVPIAGAEWELERTARLLPFPLGKVESLMNIRLTRAITGHQWRVDLYRHGNVWAVYRLGFYEGKEPTAFPADPSILAHVVGGAVWIANQGENENAATD